MTVGPAITIRQRSACTAMVNRALKARPSAFPPSAHRYRARSRYLLYRYALQAVHACARTVQRWWRRIRGSHPGKRANSTLKWRVVNAVDPFTLEPVTRGGNHASESMVYAQAAGSLPQGHVYKFEAKELVEYVIRSGRVLNPFTRDRLPTQTLFDAALACARRGGAQWSEVQSLARASAEGARASSLLELVAREVNRRESEAANRAAAAQMLEDNVRSVAYTVVTAIFRVDQTNRPVRVLNRRARAEWERLPQLGRLPRPQPTEPMLPEYSESPARPPPFSEFPGSRGPMQASAWAGADADAWMEDWARMNRALHRAGISHSQFTDGIGSMISGFMYLRQASMPRFRRVIRALVEWLRFVLRLRNPIIGPIAREIARRITWIMIARGLPLAVPSAESQAAVRFMENEFEGTDTTDLRGGLRMAAGELLINSLLQRASIVFT